MREVKEIKIPNDEYLHFLDLANNGDPIAQIVIFSILILKK
jgi:hypothetical protein